MHSTRWINPTLLLAAIVCALTLIAPASQARAQGTQPYGELTRFGLGGPGETPGTLNDEHRTRILGVDPTDNSAYVLDEPSEEEQAEREIKRGKPGCPVEEEEEEPCEFTEGPITRTLRLQKFASTGGKYSAVASASFKEQAPTVTVAAKKPTEAEVALAETFEEETSHSRGLSVEGVAVDPGLKRVYVLATDYRLPTLAIDSAAAEAPVFEKKGLVAASTLYAYSTQPEGAALKPAVGASPVLLGPEALGTQSTQAGQALLEPSGITVDPVTHEVIILAHVDTGGAPSDKIESAQDHFVLQRVHSDGTLGARYVDANNVLAKETSPERRPHSPIVVPVEHEERVYVGDIHQLMQIPYNFSSTEAAKVFFTPPPTSILEEWIKPPLQSGAPISAGPLVGGALSASPEGTVFGASTIHLEEHGEYQAVMALSGANGSILGWTGGQSQNPEAKPEERYLCAIEPLFYNPSAPIAAGSGGDVFVLAPAYLFDRNINSPSEITLYGPPSAPAVIELGPGGSGCPQAKSKEGLIARVKGVPVEGNPVKSGEPVTFSTQLRQADSLGVQWNFGDGSEQTVSANQGLHPEAKHAFTTGGTMTVTAIIHTDDLATPTLTLTTHVTISGGEECTEHCKEECTEHCKEEKGKGGGEGAPTAKAIVQAPAYRGLPALFNGIPSSDPGGTNQITTYTWAFGDGQEQSSPEPIAFHSYAGLGTYSASLTVKDKQGLTSKPYTFSVTVEEAPPPRQKRPLPGGETVSSQANNAVASYSHVAPGLLPVVTLSEALLRANSSGAVTLLLYCPAGEGTCSGTVTLRAVVAVAGGKGHKPKKARVTLASGAFALGGGTQKRFTLHLSRQARTLLAQLHSLHAQVTIAAHDQAGASHTTQLVVSLRGAPGAKHRKH